MTAAGWLAASCLAGVALAAAQSPAPTPLPPLTDDAQRLVDQWKQTQANIIDQLRFLQ